MTDTIRDTETRDPRYHVKSGKEVSVVVHTEVDGKTDSTKAELIDISSGGARLRTREPISDREITGFDLKVRRPKRMISVAGEVCWMVPANGDYWWLGCSFNPKIPDETLHQFAEGGILERRQHDREMIALMSTAKWELEKDAATVRILNFSEGGFCLLSQNEGKPGERVLLQFALANGKELLVTAKAQWQVESDEGFVMGCEFLQPTDHRIFSELKQTDLSDANAVSVWKWFGTA